MGTKWFRQIDLMDLKQVVGLVYLKTINLNLNAENKSVLAAA